MLTGRIVFEDDFILAFNKKAGELVHSDREGNESLTELLIPPGTASDRPCSQTDPSPAPAFFQPVHRLDRPASGLVLFAKSTSAFTALSAVSYTHLTLPTKRIV